MCGLVAPVSRVSMGSAGLRCRRGQVLGELFRIVSVAMVLFGAFVTGDYTASENSRSLRVTAGSLSFLRARSLICRTRSRVRSNRAPISSRV